MRLLAIALFLGLSGCVSFTSLQRADVLPEGRTRAGIAPITLGSSRRDPSLEMPLVATVRQGLGHDFELSGRFWLVGAGVGAKYQFLRTEHFAASVAPEALAYWLERDRVGADLVVPVLAGVNFGPHQLVLGARVIGRRWTADRATVPSFALYPGVIFGVDLTAGRMHVMPEWNGNWWLAGRQGFWTATLGFAWDL